MHYMMNPIEIPNSAISGYQDEYKDEKTGLPICRLCYYGLHPHGEVYDKYNWADCKVLLRDTNTWQYTGNQCCCQWKNEAKKGE